MGRDRKEASPEKAELSGDEAAKSRSRSRETPDSDRKVRETSESMRNKRDSSEDGEGKRRRSRGSSDSEENGDRKHKSKRKSRNRYGSDSDSDDSSSEDSEFGSESEYSESESETETEEERRRRKKKKERRRREEERERKRRKREKERKRRKEKEKEKEEDRKRKKKKEKKRKEKERAERGKTGAVTDSWGKYGIIRETDMWNKRPEFTAWLAEVKQVNLESLPNWEEKQMFKQFMEDHNTATFPSKKYYDLDAYHRCEMEKEMKKGMKKVRAVERTVFNDEEQRRQELLIERERHKEEQLDALKREMQGGMAQAMKEQAQLREEMAYQYKLGNFEAAAAIQRRLDPNLAM